MVGGAGTPPPQVSGGKGEGVPNQGVAPGIASPVQAEDVEAAGGEVETTNCQVERGGAGETATLRRPHRGDRRSKRGARAGLDLDEAEDPATIPRDEIDLASVVDDVALQYLVPLGLEPGHGGLFAGA